MSTARDTTTTTRRAGPVLSALVGLAAFVVLLQGLWAGIFLERDGKRDAASSWIDVHALGGEIGIALGVLATVYALWKLRSRKDLWIGSLVFTLLMVLEAYLGGLIRDSGKDSPTAVHIPLATALMALAVWLPLRASRNG